jgi:hypothetical protein
MYRHEDGLFPFSTRREHSQLRHDYAHPHTLRYTVNTLLGLQRAAPTNGAGGFLGGTDAMLERFLDLHLAEARGAADLGLLLLLLAERNGDERLAGVLRRAEEAFARTLPKRVTLQDLCWLLWGSSVAARHGGAGAEPLARRVFRLVDEGFVDRRSLLPRHSLARHRSSVVSFGAIVYFLRAAYEYGSLTGEDRPAQLFRSGLDTMLRIQGPQGQWPWMISVRTGIPLDFYPVFGVHQDSMAMLFLLPALDDGVADVEHAIRRSVAWSRGANELGEPMYGDGEFFAYRSIRRREPLVRPRRYARSVARALADRPGSLADPERLTVNRECRSYHLGWILYAWAGRTDRPRLDASWR